MCCIFVSELKYEKNRKITSLIPTGSSSTLCVLMKKKSICLICHTVLQSQKVKFKLVFQDTLLKI